MQFDTAEVTLRSPQEHGGFYLTFIKITPQDVRPVDPLLSAPRRLSLLFLHSVAGHKEAWLPAIEHLFKLQNAAPNNAFTIVEAWSMDAPSHGRAAILNESILLNFPEGITGKQWAKGAHVLLNSGLMSADAIVGIGHSAGSCVLVESAGGFPVNRIPYSTMILVEPTMMTPDILKRAFEKDTVLLRAVDVARKRKDIWPSRAAAKDWLSKRLPWRRWDPRVLDLYIEHALCDLPTRAYPDKEGVTLALTRTQEVGGYSHHEDGFEALAILQKVCPVMPVHTIFGEIVDMVPAETQASNVSEAEGRNMKSITRITGAGHLTVQEDPRGVALAIWGILHEDYARSLSVPAPRL
ncbi:hypothetical protein OH77DRAFT_1460879 [Trametes cingulata]|nr:hypothetical protein OH77DRAFT_1460879 [Trametes cingulata]